MRTVSVSIVTDSRRDPVLQQDEVEKAIELETDFTEMTDALEAEALEESEGGGIFGVDTGDHGVFAGLACIGNEGFEQERSHALPAKAGGNVHGALDGIAVAGPRTKIAVASEAAEMLTVGCHEHGVVLHHAHAPPGDAIGNAGGTVVVNRGGVGKNVVVDRGDLFEVRLDCIPDLHAIPRS